jgi:hypothetical protein
VGRASGTKWRTFWCIWAGFEENARPVEMEPSTRTSMAVDLDTTSLSLATWHFVGVAPPRTIDFVFDALIVISQKFPLPRQRRPRP